jgi:hypothetical protein
VRRAWRRFGALTQVFGGRDDQRQFWQTTTRAGRVTIALAIFASGVWMDDGR